MSKLNMGWLLWCLTAYVAVATVLKWTLGDDTHELGRYAVGSVVAFVSGWLLRSRYDQSGDREVGSPEGGSVT